MKKTQLGPESTHEGRTQGELLLKWGMKKTQTGLQSQLRGTDSGGAAATWRMKKTQLGPGSTHGNRLRGSCCYVGDEEDAARPRVNSEERTQGELLLRGG